MKLLQNNFFAIVVVALLVLLLYERCGKKQPTVAPVIKTDTAYLKKDCTIIKLPTLVKKEVSVIRDTMYLPAANYEQLVQQYDALVKELLSKNIYADTIKVDSIGYAFLKDTVQFNTITGRSVMYSLKYPVITKTITLQSPSRSQLYAGFGLEGNKNNFINQISGRLLFKNKADQMFGVSAGIDVTGNGNFGIATYWKIKLK